MPIYRQVPSRSQGGANSSNGRYQRMSVSVVASPRFEPANLSRTESGEERAWRFIRITKGGLKQFTQCVVMERPLMAQSGRSDANTIS
jgi:hypothetical protein